MIFVGADPGTDGGVGVILPNGIVCATPLPTFQQFLKGKNKSGKHKCRNHIAVDEIVALLWEMTGVSPQFWSLSLSVCIESLNHGGKFADTTGQLMKNYGRLLAIFEVFNVPMINPTPQEWQKWVQNRLSVQAKARAMLKYPDSTKGYAIEYVGEYFPQVNLIPKRGRVPHDGCADAMCQADYARHSASLFENVSR